MFNEGYSFPHPVLGNDDDISGEFNLTVDISRNENRQIDFDNITIDVNNSYVKDLLDSGKATCFIKAYCSSTLTTWMFELTGNFHIAEDELINKIELQAFVIAKKDIPNYIHTSFNSEYGAQVFSLNDKEVIATSGKTSFPIPKTDEKLGLGNIFQFNPLKDPKPIEFELHHDKIFINYPVAKNGEHPPNMIFKTMPWLAFNIFIVPAVSEALRHIASDPEDASKWEWFTVIDQLLPEESRSGNYYSDAQKIVLKDLPILLAYDELINKDR